MAFTLPPLPYDYATLEPHIDARTMEIHHTKVTVSKIYGLQDVFDYTPSRACRAGLVLYNTDSTYEVADTFGSVPCSTTRPTSPTWMLPLASFRS